MLLFYYSLLRLQAEKKFLLFFPANINGKNRGLLLTGVTGRGILHHEISLHAALLSASQITVYMKQIFLWVLLIAFGITASGQSFMLQQSFSKQDYLPENNGRRTVAWVLTAGGAVAFVAGIAVSGSNKSYFPNEEVGTALMVGGGIAAVTGIVLFSTAGRKKGNADRIDMSFSLKPERTFLFQQTGRESNYYPALSAAVKLK